VIIWQSFIANEANSGTSANGLQRLKGTINPLVLFGGLRTNCQVFALKIEEIFRQLATPSYLIQKAPLLSLVFGRPIQAIGLWRRRAAKRWDNQERGELPHRIIPTNFSNK
jgi:hypothetical protein